MAKKRYYAVKSGYETGVFDNWNDCEKATKGYSNPDFKSFSNKEDAEAYLNDVDNAWIKIGEDIENGYIVAYTDGSYDKQSGKYGYGVVIFDDKLEMHELYSNGKNEKYAGTNNIAGEIFAAINAMDWAVSNGYNKLKIYHDYEGIAKWAEGIWNANSEIAKMYVNIVNGKYKDILEVKFEHVKGHSGNKYNEMADKLAKESLSEGKRKLVTGDNWFVRSYVKLEKLEEVLNKLKRELTDLDVSVKASNGNCSLYKLKQGKDILTVNLFNTGTMQVQGKITLLFQMFLSMFIEENAEGLTQILNSTYRVAIRKSNIEEIMNHKFSVLPQDYPENIKTMIKQALVNNEYMIDGYDYGQYVYPALRALEGHIRYKLEKNGRHVRSIFNMFNYDTQNCEYVIQPGVASMLSNTEKISIEKCYNYYTKNRHTIFHYGEIIGQTDNTRLISTKKEAKDLISDTLELILETL